MINYSNKGGQIMKVKDPAKTADEIVDTYNSRDPERIAKLCGILIKEVD